MNAEERPLKDTCRIYKDCAPATQRVLVDLQSRPIEGQRDDRAQLAMLQNRVRS